MKKDLLSLTNLEKEEIEEILERASVLKDNLKKGISYRPLEGRILGLIFQKPSTRTRVSFEAGMYQLGGTVIFLNTDELQLSRGEGIKDSAMVLSRYLDGLVIRTYSQEKLEEFAHHATIPVINGLTDLLHPCQILSDIFTIKEKRGGYRGIKVAYVGDGNNVANSWLYGASKLGINLSIASPKGYQPNKEILKTAISLAYESGARIDLFEDPFKAVNDADIIYTDVWTSMGQEKEYQKRKKIFRDYQINKKLVDAAKKEVLVMHCMPVHREEEITSEVMDGPMSIIIEQSENRLHTQKAILEILLA
ncbi:MAG TPA: ornithine carbamoyltransferase [Nitrospinota bacterium]|nr:ornithine carbamoyltransferase [Nitrospinota bacterium]